jgi:preprotein translocase subunit SecY
VIESLRNVFKVKELRERVIFTLGILVIYRIGGHIPTPGIDGAALTAYFQQAKGTLFGMFDLFVGGAFTKATIFALGIMPYISASIIIQLLGPVVPYFQRLQKEGEEGRRKITQYTRYGTVLLAALQAYATSIYLESLTGLGNQAIVPSPGWDFRALVILTLTCGTIFVMWLGEKITERGIGNGISLIIYAGIISTFPDAILEEVQLLLNGQRNVFTEVFMLALMVGIVMSIVMVTRAQRKVPVQYPKRIVGRRMMGGAQTNIPLSVNTAGVIPIIFAQSVMFFPATIAQFFPTVDWVQNIAGYFNYTSWTYSAILGIIIVFFAFFYTAIVFNPIDIADNLKKNGGFIPGVRPGKRTAEYVDKVLTRITLPGAIFFALIAVVPYWLINQFGVQFYFGGTSILIVVGVALDTLQQVESHLIMRHYDGFMKRGRIRGRSM